MKNVKTDGLLLEAWKQQIDAGRRLMELQAELTCLTCASAQKWAAYWRGLYVAPRVSARARKKRAS